MDVSLAETQISTGGGERVKDERKKKSIGGGEDSRCSGTGQAAIMLMRN